MGRSGLLEFQKPYITAAVTAMLTLLVTAIYGLSRHEDLSALGHPIKTPIGLAVISTRAAYPFSTELFQATAPDIAMRLVASIANISDSPVTISTDAAVVIGVVSVSLNGQPLTPVFHSVAFETNPMRVASEFLVTLAPGGKINFPINTVNRFDIETGRQPRAITYTPAGPGEYEFVFQYFYNGLDRGFPNVFHGIARSPPLRVQVN